MKKDIKSNCRYAVMMQNGKPQINIGYADIVGDKAYFYRRTDSKKAEIIPSISVFETKVEAELYISENGQKKWVVCEVYDSNYENSSIVALEAMVSQYVFNALGPIEVSIKDIKSGKIIEKKTKVRYFSNKQEAVKELKSIYVKHIRLEKSRIKGSTESIKKAKIDYEQALKLQLPSFILNEKYNK